MSAVMPIGIAAGYLADVVFGDPHRWHPVAGFGQVATNAESLMWRPTRSAGVAYAALLVGTSYGCGVAVSVISRRRPLLRTATVAAALWGTLGGRSLAREARGVEAALAAGDLPTARRLGQRIVGRDLSSAPANEVARAVVESVAENTTDAIVAPLLWTAAAGPAGALAYRAANTLDAMVGHRVERYARFGWAAARLDDLLTWPAARIASLLAICLSATVGGNCRSTWQVVHRDGARHPSPNAGRIEAAFAGALGVRLGGTSTYFGVSETRGPFGDGEPPRYDDIPRAISLANRCGAFAAILATATAARRFSQSRRA
jgi:adenosylcobinamide-phosphate synthase